jgi:hypothetical protein
MIVILEIVVAIILFDYIMKYYLLNDNLLMKVRNSTGEEILAI